VVLEVTESTMMSDTSQVILVLADLRAAGIRIAIGDFGTGHSSLDRLHQLPVDQVKIDRSLIGAAAVDGGSAEEVGGRSRPGTTMLDLLVAVVDRLGLDLVAAGIETPVSSRTSATPGAPTARAPCSARHSQPPTNVTCCRPGTEPLAGGQPRSPRQAMPPR
jgi:EAL domain-containing protein (putative c-di-GMP-specific phosphodiesterase class I)